MTRTPYHCADNDSYRQRSAADLGGDVGQGDGILGVSVGINK